MVQHQWKTTTLGYIFEGLIIMTIDAKNAKLKVFFGVFENEPLLVTTDEKKDEPDSDD